MIDMLLMQYYYDGTLYYNYDLTSIENYDMIDTTF